jgi:signal peptidase I
MSELDTTDSSVTQQAEPASTPTKHRKSATAQLVEWLVVVAVAIACALLVQTFVVKQFAVSGNSMLTTLHNGDRVLVNRLSYRLHDPRRGDVVVLKRFDVANTERDLIKRVIGLPGESVEVRDCEVFIDGQRLIEPYLDPTQAPCTSPGQQNPFVVPPDEVFVMGDNRDNSGDSRMFGSVPYDLLIGRAFVVIWPVGDWQWL